MSRRSLNHSRRFAALALAGVLAAGAAFCASADETELTGNKAPAEGAPEVDTSEENTIRFADNPGTIRYAIVILANKLGYYNEEGVNVEFTPIQDATSALTAISTGKDELDVLGTGIVPDLAFIGGGSDLTVFEGTAAEGGAIIAKPENVEKYKDLKNLEGVKAALVRNDSAWVWTRVAMKDQGLDPDTLDLVEVDSNANTAQAVAKGEAEIGFLPLEFVSSYKDIGIDLVAAVGDLVPQYVCCRQVTSSSKLAEKRDAFVKFSRANLRAWEYYSDPANRDSIDSLLADFSGQTEDYVDNYLFVNKTTLTLDPNTKGVEALYEELQDTGVIDKSSEKVEDHIDTSIYKEALDSLAEENPDDEFYQEKLKLYEEYNA